MDYLLLQLNHLFFIPQTMIQSVFLCNISNIVCLTLMFIIWIHHRLISFQLRLSASKAIIFPWLLFFSFVCFLRMNCSSRCDASGWKSSFFFFSLFIIRTRWLSLPGRWPLRYQRVSKRTFWYDPPKHTWLHLLEWIISNIVCLTYVQIKKT